MEDCYETLKEDKPTSPELQIIRHPSYQPCSKLTLPWLDIRVFYVRISNIVVDDSTPESLSLNLVPLSHDTFLDVNGSRCNLYSDAVSCLLRRDRADKESEEATFVSTDNIRLTGSVIFEVLDKVYKEPQNKDTENLILSGVLEMSSSNGFVGESKQNSRRWSMKCEPSFCAGTGFLKGNQIVGSESLLPPSIEVYVAGCFFGTPIILTKSLQLNSRKKHNRKVMLHSIAEYESSDSTKEVASELDLQVARYGDSKAENEEDYNSMVYWSRQTEYMEGEDGELSWFNAGVRVGVGIGLGICLGVGIGVGLLVRTYHATTRNFRRRLP